jgi:hypothetical protein
VRGPDPPPGASFSVLAPVDSFRQFANVAELVYAQVLGTCGETHPGSSPGVRMEIGSNHLEHRVRLSAETREISMSFRMSFIAA